MLLLRAQRAGRAVEVFLVDDVQALLGCILMRVDFLSHRQLFLAPCFVQVRVGLPVECALLNALVVADALHVWKELLATGTPNRVMSGVSLNTAVLMDDDIVGLILFYPVHHIESLVSI